MPDALSRAVPIVETIDQPIVAQTSGSASGKDSCADTWYAAMIKKVNQKPSDYPLWRIEGNKLYKKCKPSFATLLDPSTSWLLVLPRALE